MRNLTNVQNYVKSDARINVLMKKQETEHQHLLASHNREMQALRESLSISMQKFESLSNRNEQELKDFKTYTVSYIGILNTKIMTNERIMNDQKKTIDDLHNQLIDFHVSYASKVDVEKFKRSIDAQVKEAMLNHLSALQQLQMELKVLLNYLKDDFTNYKQSMEKKFTDLIDKVEANFNINKIDREGVLKEIRIYDKTIFIIEKKIENIYTLIERMNK